MNPDIYIVIEHLQGQVLDISYVMLAAARVLAQGTGGRVVAVLLGHNAQELAMTLAADQVLYVDHSALADFTPEAYQQTLASIISENMPHAVLFGDTSIGADVAGGLSVRLNLPIVSKCYSIRVDNGIPKFISQICGGKIMAEGDLPTSTTLVMMMPGGFKPELGQSIRSPEIRSIAAPVLEELRVTLNQYIKPESGAVDITKEAILIAVGRGIQREDNLELAEELAELLGGAVCASRPVVDQGWLPTTQLVGKSGKRVKPKVYLALGISGAPEHVEAITNSELVIAVNSDPAAPIFDVAQYGAEVDIFDLLPTLIDQIRETSTGLEKAA